MRHVYVHVPFCRRRCSYCDFAIAVRKHVPSERYVDAVLEEYEWRRAQRYWDTEALETLYLGGGTPSLLAPDALDALVRTIRDGESAAADSRHPTPLEVTLEANPDDVTAERASAWADIGINRISLGAQSFDPDVLAWMHRTHDAASIERAVATLRMHDFLVSIDLIFARPEGRAGHFTRDLDRAIALEPDHVSVYGLTVEPGTALAKWVEGQAMTPAPEERYAEEFLCAHERLTNAGFEHYEVSNYAKPGRRARHNSAYWSLAPYMGLGPSAHSYRDGRRWWNVREWAAYERVMCEGGDPTAGEEVLTPDQRQLEQLYLGLRTAEGVSLSASLPLCLSALVERGWLRVSGDRVRPTVAGWLRLDSLTPALTTSGESG